MALGRTYTIDSGQITIGTATTPQPVISAYTTTTNVADIECIRVGIFSNASVSYPSNGTVLCQLARVTTTGTASGTLTPHAHNQTDLAANTSWATGGWQTTPTTTGYTILWGQSIPFTAGANWAEWVTPGAEWRIGPTSTTAAAAYLALFVTVSSTSSNTSIVAEIVFSE